MKKLMLVLVLGVVLLSATPVFADGGSVFIPFLQKNGECFRVDVKTTLYCAPKNFEALVGEYSFISSTYYGYFAKASIIKNIDSGVEYAREASVELLPGDEARVRAAYPGRVVFVQRLKTKTKLTFYTNAMID